MKNILLITAALVLVSCSSSKKQPEAPTSTPEVVQAPEVTSSQPEVTPEEEPQPMNTTSELPEITGTSILDVNCAMGQDQRQLSLLERTDDRGWGVVYHKFGTKKTIAIARNDKSFCDEVVSRVKNTLQEAGFQCDGDAKTVSTPVSGDESSDSASGQISEAKEKASAAAKDVVEKVKDSAAGAMDEAKEAAQGE